MEPPGVERRLAAILAADMVGYSRLMEADDTLEVVARRVMPVFRDHLDAPMRAFGKLQERAVEVQNVLTASRQKAADDLEEERAALR